MIITEEDIKNIKHDLELIKDTKSSGNYTSYKIDQAIEYINQLESREQKLIDKLEKDIVNITKIMQDGKHCDDYSRCRLKAYRTKTKEILSILKGEQ